MEVIGLIAEYNPLHNGHIYQIKKIKELYPDSLIILILNGYFTQRGTISYMTKEDKIKSSLNENIDLVLELPYVYGTQSADIFAYKSIEILNKFKINKLVFGSESENITLLEELALKEEEKDYNLEVKSYLKKGLNYPTALAKALKIDFDFQPNDLLAISYLKAIHKINNKIIPIPIKRTNSYHDNQSNNDIVSASNIRERINKNEDIKKYTPYFQNIIIPNFNTFYQLLKYKIITDQKLNDYLDVDEGIEYRLNKIINNTNNFLELSLQIKTKRYTYNRLNRMFCHILIGLTKKDKNFDDLYIRVLGFNKEGQKYLKDLDLNYYFDKKHPLYQYELKASLIYDLIMNTNTYSYELRNKPIIKD